MSRKVGLMVLFVAFGGLMLLPAWEWPFAVLEGREEVPFAGLRDGGLVPGVWFNLVRKAVLPVEPGEIVFFSQGNAERHFGIFQDGPGLVLVSHGNGMRSTYAGLEKLGDIIHDPFLVPEKLSFYSALTADDKERLSALWRVDRETVVGTSGERLFLGISDPVERTCINPWSLLPADPLPGAPRLVSFKIEQPDSGELVPGFSWMDTTWKKIVLHVTCRDPGTESGAGGAKGRMPAGTSLLKVTVKKEGAVLAVLDLRTLQADPKTGLLDLADDRHRRLGFRRTGEATLRVGLISLEAGNNPLDIVLENSAGLRSVWRVWLRVKESAVPSAP